MGLKNPYVFAILMQTIQAGMTLLTKAAINGGMNSFIFIFYRQLTGTIFLVLSTAIFKRRSATPLTILVFFKIFAVAFVGLTLALNLYGIALLYTSASLTSAAINCVPVTTFFFAVLLRREKLNVRSIAGVAKLGGIAICLAGVATLAFFEGPILKPPFALHNAQHQHHVSSSRSKTRIIVSLWGLWYVLQAGVLKDYPSKLHFTSLQCFSSTIQSFLVAISVERDFSEWKLTWNVRLLAVLYCGIMVSGVGHYLQSWVIATKGPVFRGIIVGEIMLVVGLYSVLWGQTHEQNLATNNSLQAEKKCTITEDQEPKNVETRYMA
ncbi:hypothetical protein BT93_I0129 [Corymbia citriodora subsp. variegata]|nr:hypothetical protein BT93_I0129 [Corymbia citriodora subsp. variegata]